MIVVDASVAVKWFINEPGHDAAMRLFRTHEPLIAPDFALIEVMNVLRRKHRQKTLSYQHMMDAAGTLIACFSQLIPAMNIIRAAVDLSVTLDHSVYDCTYLACAISENAILMTADQVFAEKATRGGYARRIAVFGNN